MTTAAPHTGLAIAADLPSPLSICGFLATFEPSTGALTWRVGYTVPLFLSVLLAQGGLRPLRSRSER
ncbi:MAG: hypothetical protein CMJ84_06635 [Planctomycetes bacterium]|nr:hypothetical protein [Planctomycetota bacterium]